MIAEHVDWTGGDADDVDKIRFIERGMYAEICRPFLAKDSQGKKPASAGNNRKNRR